MALRWLESFDHADKSTYGVKYHVWKGKTQAGGRHNNLMLPAVGGWPTARRTFASTHATWITGFAFQFAALTSSYVCAFLDGSSRQVEIYLDGGTGKLRVRRHGTVLATGTTALIPNTWYYVEFKATIANSGSYELRLNGQTELSAAAVDTQYTANAYADGAGIGDNGQTRFDDWYVCDGSGADNNDFLGDIAVQCLMPDGAGNYSQWTASAGSNYQNVDEIPPNDDTDYNYTATAGDRDSYSIEDLTEGSVLGIQFNTRIRKDDAGSHVVAPFVRRSGSDYDQSSEGVSDSYVYIPRVLETDPSTGAAWTRTGLNAAEFGVKLVS